MKDKTKTKLRFFMDEIVPWLFVLIWMGIIFYFSSQVSGSSDHLSQGVVKRIYQFVYKGSRTLSKTELDAYNHMLRKIAHFTFYMIMGVFASNAMYHLRVKKRYWILVSMLICVLFAMSDEFHQVFVPGRVPLITDVLIDSCGALLGTTLYSMIRKVNYSKSDT